MKNLEIGKMPGKVMAFGYLAGVFQPEGHGHFLQLPGVPQVPPQEGGIQVSGA